MNPDILLFIPLISETLDSTGIEWREVAITIRHEFRNKKLLTRICNIILIKHVFFSIPQKIIVKYLLMQGV